MNERNRSAARRRRRTLQLYARLLRLYPRAHREAFGEQMLQTFVDHYLDAVERCGEPEGRFWLGVVTDEGRSVLREHLAALIGKGIPVKKVFAVGVPITTSAALLVVTVLLVSAASLVSLVAPYPGWQDQMRNNPSLSTFTLNVAVERPISHFIVAFAQSAAAVGAHELRQYHFKPARVEVSTYPLALSGPDTSVLAVLIDGEPAARLAGDLRVVQGRLPAPSSAVLEVVVTQTTADQLHLALGAVVGITANPAQLAPLVRVVGIVQLLTTTFPMDRQSNDLVSSDVVSGYAEQHPLDYVLTSTEAIGAYPFDWSQVTSLQTFYNHGGPSAQPLPPSKNPPLWQAWWMAQANFAQMTPQEFTAFFWRINTSPSTDASPRLNQLLSEQVSPQQTGFVPADTTALFYQGDAFGDYQDSVVFPGILLVLALAAVVAGLLACLDPVTGTLVEREAALVAALRRRGGGRVKLLGAFAAQVLVLAGVALVVGALLAELVARLAIEALWWPPSGQRATAMLADLPASNRLIGVLVGALVGLIGVLVMLRAMGRAVARLPQDGQHEGSV